MKRKIVIGVELDSCLTKEQIEELIDSDDSDKALVVPADTKISIVYEDDDGCIIDVKSLI